MRKIRLLLPFAALTACSHSVLKAVEDDKTSGTSA